MAEKKKKQVTIRSSAAEYLTYVASVGDSADGKSYAANHYSVGIRRKSEKVGEE